MKVKRRQVERGMVEVVTLIPSTSEFDNSSSLEAKRLTGIVSQDEYDKFLDLRNNEGGETRCAKGFPLVKVRETGDWQWSSYRRLLQRAPLR